jgi:quinohemoprotein ethanol dehydrogenase
LAQIDQGNVGRLGLAWEYSMNTSGGQEATPIVVDGVLYTSGTTGRAYAIDGATGRTIWTFDPRSDGQFMRYNCCGDVNRGVAVHGGRVYVASLDGRLFSLDAKTGAVQWEVDTLIYPERAANITGAPEVAGKVVVIGNGGAELKTGEFKWRFFTVPTHPKEPVEHPELEMAAKTWDPNSRWDIGGGGTAWDALVYDPELNLLYVGTGNGTLRNWRERSPFGGDNLFLCSILALDPGTGRMIWYHQQIPGERWDYTATAPMILATIQFAGAPRKVLMQAPKSGFFYVYDRQDGELLAASPYVPVNWATHVDLTTGRPAIDAEAADFSSEPKFVYPSFRGGHNWNPMAYSPDTSLVYIPAIEDGMVTGDLTVGHEYRPKQFNTGVTTLFGPMLARDPATAPEPLRKALGIARDSGLVPGRDVLKAYDPVTGKVVWEHESDAAGVLATAGGLVFKGTGSGHLQAYEATTGEQRLNLHVGSHIIAAPMTYSIEGVQYIAVQTGHGGGGWPFPPPTSAVRTYGNANRILAFKLDGDPVRIPDPLPPVPPLPEPPPRLASQDVIARGSELWQRICSNCHANVDRGLSPDLRRMSADVHASFNDIVLRGARRASGMPQWDDALSENDADAIHAYLIDLAWSAYRAQAAP